MENFSRVFQKQKRNRNMKRLSFITQFKVQFLVPFTGYKKVLGKMPDSTLKSPLKEHFLRLR